MATNNKTKTKAPRTTFLHFWCFFLLLLRNILCLLLMRLLLTAKATAVIGYVCLLFCPMTTYIDAPPQSPALTKRLNHELVFRTLGRWPWRGLHSKIPFHLSSASSPLSSSSLFSSSVFLASFSFLSNSSSHYIIAAARQWAKKPKTTGREREDMKRNAYNGWRVFYVVCVCLKTEDESGDRIQGDPTTHLVPHRRIVWSAFDSRQWTRAFAK